MRALCVVGLVLVLALCSHGSTAVAGNLLHETFESGDNWVSSKDSQYNGEAKVQDNGLLLTEESRRYGISTKLAQQWQPGQALVLQYELQLTETTLECGGAYLKLLSGSPEPLEMKESDPFTVMFGPDKCGGTNKVHLIFKHKNPVSNELVEHHMSKQIAVPNDKQPHLYTLIVRPDNTFSVMVDLEERSSGSLTSDTDFEPAFTPPKQIEDPEDKKPEDWVDEAKIDDPEASKPDDWDEDAPATIPDEDAVKPAEWHDDEPEKVPDPEATMPDDWSEEDDGPWEAPIVDNPKCQPPGGCGEWVRPTKTNPDYKGKWYAPKIDNPAYKGVWKPQQIDNPNFFECTDPAAGLAPIGSVAVEVWVHKPKGIQYSNILLSTEEAPVTEYGSATWKVRADAAKAKAAQEAKEAQEKARQKMIEEGGFLGMIQGYTSTVVELMVDNPWASIPAVLLVFYLLFSACFGGGKNAAVVKEDVKEEATTRAAEEAAQAEDDAEPAAAAADDDGKRKLRPRKKAASKKGADSTAEETDKDK